MRSTATAIASNISSMQSLLSQTEGNAFQSFLSSMDYTEDAIPADEWAAFSASSASMELSYPDEDRQALTKATKDLMSLDTDGNWDNPNDTSMMNRSPIIHPHFDDHETHQQQSHLGQHQPHRYQQPYRANSYSSRHDSFPFLHTKSQQQQQSQPIQFPIQHHPVSPLRTGSPDPQPCSPNSPRSPYGFSQQQQLHQAHMPQQQPQRRRDRETSLGTRPKRSHTLPSTSPSFARPSFDSPYKRQRLSPSDCPPATASAGFSSPGHSSSNRPPRQQQPSKPNLLSVSQKKANHIQSEQKRRANIRRGYAALCETVPALREAIREEEEAGGSVAVDPNITAVNGISVGAEVRTNSAGKKRRSKKGTVADGKDLDDRDKEKIDGRAGPISENTVLSKTIEHIQHLLTERSSLLTRLQHARASLPVGHPALNTLSPDPLWEKKWKGGEGKLNPGDGDGDEERDRDGGSGDEEEDG